MKETALFTRRSGKPRPVQRTRRSNPPPPRTPTPYINHNREIYCEEIGIPASDKVLTALAAMTSIFNETSDVSVVTEEAIVKISGTATAVENASRAVRAVVSRQVA